MDISKQLKISPIQVTSSNVVEELEISGGKVSFTKRFLKASKRTRKAFPEPQPFTAPNFPPNVTPQYKPAPHPRPLQLPVIQLQGAIFAVRMASRNPISFIIKILFGDPPL